MLRNTTETFGWISIGIHWLMAVVILGLFGLGIWMVELSYYDDWYRTGPFIHKSIGILLFLVLLFRLFWRFTNPTPRAASSNRLEILAARAAHVLLYVLLFVIMVSGYFISTADGRGIEVFGWFEVPALPAWSENQEDIAGDVHALLAWVLIGIVIIHAGAALKHHFWDGDRTLKRMLGLK